MFSPFKMILTVLYFCVQDVEGHKENLEAQLVCWDQVQTGKEEVESWVNTMVTKLDDSLKHFDDAVSVESCLMKYKVIMD